MITEKANQHQIIEIPEFEPQVPVIVNNKLEKKWLKLRVSWQWFLMASEKNKNPLKGFIQLKKMHQKYEKVFGGQFLNKVVRVDNRYFWRLGSTGFPSRASKTVFSIEFDKFSTTPKSGLRTLFLAITKKCPLQCEHCFEWDNLNQDEKLSRDDLISIVKKYQEYQTAQILFSGGEPLLRFNDLIAVLKAAKTGTDFWVITSGIGLTETRALQLKKAGLTGVMISLDHFEPEAHNRFRGFSKAYQSVIKAALSAKNANLVIVLALCVRKEFVNEANLESYMELARKLGVAFVQFIEPRAKGRYAGKNVDLTPDQIRLLECTYLKYNREKEYRDYPIINYIGYHQRRVGCFGGGNRFFYIDTDGEAHLCPFCEEKTGSTLEFSATDTISLLQQHQCHAFIKSEL